MRPSSLCHPNTNCLGQPPGAGPPQACQAGGHSNLPLTVQDAPIPPSRAQSMSHNPIPWPCAWNLLPPPLHPISHIWGHPISGPGPLSRLLRPPLPSSPPSSAPSPPGATHACTHTHRHFIHCQVLASLSQPVSFPEHPPNLGPARQPGPVTAPIFLILHICPGDDRTFQFSVDIHSLPSPD